MIRIGIDFGGTKIEAAALDSAGALLARERTANPGHYDAALRTVADLVGAVEARAGGGSSLGIGIPGSISPHSGLVRNANSLFLNGRPFGEDLQAALGRPVRLANDANCMALSEAVDGAGAGARGVVFGVIIGTGCGGGVVFDGRLIDGAQGVAGEWGHVPLPWLTDEDRAPACWCGRRHCMETYVSGAAFEADYQRATGRRRGAPEIVQDLRAGERWAAAAFDRYVDRLARGLAMIVDILDPEVIVLAGGMSNVAELYDRLPAAIAPHVFADAWSGRVAQAKHGDSSGVRGAAWLWPLTAVREPAPA